MRATYDRQVRSWMTQKNVAAPRGGLPTHDAALDVLFATSLYGGQYYTQYNGMTFERSAHFRALADDLANHKLDHHNRPPSLNEVADVKGFNFFLDFDCVAPVEDDFVNKLVPALVGVFIESMEADVDYSGVQVVVTTTLDDSYEMTTYVEQKETCPMCSGEVSCMPQHPNRLECRTCKAWWTWTPSGPAATDQTVYLETYGNSTATPQWVSRPKSGFHVRFHNATVTLRQAQDLTNAMRQKAMTVHRDVTADQWQSVIDQAPLVRKEGTKTIGLRMPFTCKGQACRTCHGRGRLPDFTRTGVGDVACVGCHGAGKVALRGKTYGILNVWYPCLARRESDGQWTVKSLLELVRDAEQEEVVGEDYGGGGGGVDEGGEGGGDGASRHHGSRDHGSPRPGQGPRGGPAKRGADGAARPAGRRLKFAHPSQLWLRVRERGGTERASTPLEELARVRPQTVQHYIYALDLCSIASVNPAHQCTAKVVLPTWCPVDGQVRSDPHVKKQLAKLARGGCNPQHVTMARWNQARETLKCERVDPDAHDIIADIMRGTDAVYRECVVSGAYWMDKRHSCIVCYADGPGSNYCMCLQREHQSSRAKFVIHALYGVRIKCSSIKKTNECVTWEGTPWKRLDPAYHGLLFGGGGAGGADGGGADAAYDVPRLVDKYEFLQEHFAGAANVHLLQAYYGRLQDAANVLNSLQRCALTKKARVHHAGGFLDYFQKSSLGIECTRAPPAIAASTTAAAAAAAAQQAGSHGRRSAHHILAITPPAAAAGGARSAAHHFRYLRLRDRARRVPWVKVPPVAPPKHEHRTLHHTLHRTSTAHDGGGAVDDVGDVDDDARSYEFDEADLDDGNGDEADGKGEGQGEGQGKGQGEHAVPRAARQQAQQHAREHVHGNANDVEGGAFDDS